MDVGKTLEPSVAGLLKPLDNLNKGTAVIWKELDRVIDRNDGVMHDPKQSFLNKFFYVKEYLEMVFHQYLESRTNKLKIHVGIAECEPWDPYLRNNNLKQELSSEKYEDSRVQVIPYVLPHVSNRTDQENEKGGGPKGWNAQQGFYVYRNKRMIVSGGYLDFDIKPEEHYKLARIKIEITNDMDHEWNIDVRKAVASPPDRLKAELLRIARVTRQKASDVYRARTGRAGGRRTPANNIYDVWIKKQSGEKIIYKLNLKNPVLKKLLMKLIQTENG